jgi:hypothetical protein
MKLIKNKLAIHKYIVVVLALFISGVSLRCSTVSRAKDHAGLYHCRDVFFSGGSLEHKHSG